jgi:hypothetical protein
MLLARPSWSSMPSRLPEKQITLGNPAAAESSMPFLTLLDALVVVLDAIEALADGVAGGHRADQVVLFQGRPLVGTGQLDRFQPQLGTGCGKLVEVHLRLLHEIVIAPEADRVVDPAFQFGRPGLREQRPGGGEGRRTGNRFEHLAAGLEEDLAGPNSSLMSFILSRGQEQHAYAATPRHGLANYDQAPPADRAVNIEGVVEQTFIPCVKSSSSITRRTLLKQSTQS